jgi:hypothetical protein
MPFHACRCVWVDRALNRHARGQRMSGIGTALAPLPVREHLPSMEVLCALQSLCSSQGHVRGPALGTDLGDSLRVTQELVGSRRGNKKAICWPFAKPSDGLEPSTPSLPWRLKRGATASCIRAFGLVSLVLCGFSTFPLARLEVPRITLRHPRPIPKTCPQGAVRTGYRRQDLEVSNWHAGDDSDQAGSPFGSSGVITLAQPKCAATRRGSG